jgi:hypothetical protein
VLNRLREVPEEVVRDALAAARTKSTKAREHLEPTEMAAMPKAVKSSG